MCGTDRLGLCRYCGYNKLWSHAHLPRKDESEWVTDVVKDARPRGRPNRTWKEVVMGDMKSKDK